MSRENAHVVHEIGTKFSLRYPTECSKIGCEQQNVLAHDTNDPPRHLWVGAENTSFVCAGRKVFGVPPCADQCENSRTCAVVGRANRCTACASPCRFPCLLDGCHKFGFLQVCFRDQRCVEIRSENEVPGMIAPVCHIALHDNTFSNFEFAFPASVFASSSGRVMTKGVAPFFATQAAGFHLWLTAHNISVVRSIMKQKQMITIWLSVWKTDCRLKGNKQKGTTHVSVGVVDVLTDR